jgi:hypothetical protein
VWRPGIFENKFGHTVHDEIARRMGRPLFQRNDPHGGIAYNMAAGRLFNTAMKIYSLREILWKSGENPRDENHHFVFPPNTV